MIGAAALPAVVFRPGVRPDEEADEREVRRLLGQLLGVGDDVDEDAGLVAGHRLVRLQRTEDRVEPEDPRRDPEPAVADRRGEPRGRHDGRLGRVRPGAGLREQGGLPHAEEAHRPEPLAPGPFHQHGVGRLDPARTLAADAGRRLDVGRVGEVEAGRPGSPPASGGSARRTCATPASGPSPGRPPTATGPRARSRPDWPRGTGPSRPAPARGRRTPAASRRSAATAVGIPRSIGSAMNSPMSSARPVITPSTPRSSAAITGSGPIRATIRSAWSTSPAVSGATGPRRARRGRRRSPPAMVASSRSRSTSDRTTPTSSDQPLRSAERVERLQAGVEMRVGPGDPEREDEGHTVLDRGPHVRLDVGRLVGRHLLAGAEPVRAPVAAGALRHDDVDAPLERPRDVGLDPGDRRDVVDEGEDPDRFGHHAVPPDERRWRAAPGPAMRPCRTRCAAGRRRCGPARGRL